MFVVHLNHLYFLFFLFLYLIFMLRSFLLLFLLPILILNPSLFIILFIVLVSYLSVKGLFMIFTDKKSSSKTCAREFVYRKSRVSEIEKEIHINNRFLVLDKLLILIKKYWFLELYGGILFYGLTGSSFLDDLLINVPVDFLLFFFKSKDTGDLYLLVPKTSATFYNKQEKISLLIEVLNSISLLLPASNIKILSGQELKQFMLPPYSGFLKINY